MSRRTLEMVIGRPEHRGLRRGLAASLVAALLGAAACGKVETAPRTPPPIVEVAPVMQRDMRIYKEWVGTVDGSINAEIRPQVEGRLLRQLYHEGSFVKKGDVLFEIDPRRLQAAFDRARGDLSRHEAALARMELDVARSTPLGFEEAIEPQEVDLAPSTLREAQADVESARTVLEMARVNLAWTRVTSPIDGIAGIARAQAGDLVGAHTVLTIVSTVDPIRVLFYAPRRDSLSWMRRRGPADRQPSAPHQGKGAFELLLSDGSLYAHRGDPAPYDRELDVRTGTVTMTVLFPNPDHLLRPGQYGRVRAAVDVGERALLVPQRAVFELQGVFQVAVVGPDNRVDIRAVQTGERVGLLRVIEKGLDPGDRVVVEGIQTLNTGTVVQPRPVETDRVLQPNAAGGVD